MRIISSLFLIIGVSLCMHSATADETLRKKISDASQSCGGDGNVTKATAPVIITRCQTALNTLNGLYDPIRMDTFDKSWFDFHGGATMILLAGAYVVENDNKLSVNACQNALRAEMIWSRIDAAPGSKLESDVKNDALFNKLVPLCKKVFTAK